jgi:transcriptional regulator with XRE-family HTH domain
MKESNSIYQSRIKLGWTQAELSMYLKISESLLSMAELGLRQLPQTAYFSLMELVLNFAENSGIEIDVTLNDEETGQYQKLIQKKIKDKEWQIMKLQKKREELEAEISNLAERKTIYQQTLLKILPTDLNANWKTNLLEIQQIKTAKVDFAQLHFELTVAQAALAGLELEISLLKG